MQSSRFLQKPDSCIRVFRGTTAEFRAQLNDKLEQEEASASSCATDATNCNCLRGRWREPKDYELSPVMEHAIASFLYEKLATWPQRLEFAEMVLQKREKMAKNSESSASQLGTRFDLVSLIGEHKTEIDEARNTLTVTLETKADWLSLIIPGNAVPGLSMVCWMGGLPVPENGLNAPEAALPSHQVTRQELRRRLLCFKETRKTGRAERKRRQRTATRGQPPLSPSEFNHSRRGRPRLRTRSSSSSSSSSASASSRLESLSADDDADEHDGAVAHVDKQVDHDAEQEFGFSVERRRPTTSTAREERAGGMLMHGRDVSPKHARNHVRIYFVEEFELVFLVFNLPKARSVSCITASSTSTYAVGPRTSQPPAVQARESDSRSFYRAPTVKISEPLRGACFCKARILLEHWTEAPRRQPAGHPRLTEDPSAPVKTEAKDTLQLHQHPHQVSFNFDLQISIAHYGLSSISNPARNGSGGGGSVSDGAAQSGVLGRTFSSMFAGHSISSVSTRTIGAGNARYFDSTTQTCPARPHMNVVVVPDHFGTLHAAIEALPHDEPFARILVRVDQALKQSVVVDKHVVIEGWTMKGSSRQIRIFADEIHELGEEDQHGDGDNTCGGSTSSFPLLRIEAGGEQAWLKNLCFEGRRRRALSEEATTSCNEMRRTRRPLVEVYCGGSTIPRGGENGSNGQGGAAGPFFAQCHFLGGDWAFATELATNADRGRQSTSWRREKLNRIAMQPETNLSSWMRDCKELAAGDSRIAARTGSPRPTLDRNNAHDDDDVHSDFFDDAGLDPYQHEEKRSLDTRWCPGEMGARHIPVPDNDASSPEAELRELLLTRDALRDIRQSWRGARYKLLTPEDNGNEEAEGNVEKRSGEAGASRSACAATRDSIQAELASARHRLTALCRRIAANSRNCAIDKRRLCQFCVRLVSRIDAFRGELEQPVPSSPDCAGRVQDGVVEGAATVAQNQNDLGSERQAGSIIDLFESRLLVGDDDVTGGEAEQKIAISMCGKKLEDAGGTHDERPGQDLAQRGAAACSADAQAQRGIGPGSGGAGETEEKERLLAAYEVPSPGRRVTQHQLRKAQAGQYDHEEINGGPDLIVIGPRKTAIVVRDASGLVELCEVLDLKSFPIRVKSKAICESACSGPTQMRAVALRPGDTLADAPDSLTYECNVEQRNFLNRARFLNRPGARLHAKGDGDTQFPLFFTFRCSAPDSTEEARLGRNAGEGRDSTLSSPAFFQCTFEGVAVSLAAEVEEHELSTSRPFRLRQTTTCEGTPTRTSSSTEISKDAAARATAVPSPSKPLFRSCRFEDACIFAAADAWSLKVRVERCDFFEPSRYFLKRFLKQQGPPGMKLCGRSCRSRAYPVGYITNYSQSRLVRTRRRNDAAGDDVSPSSSTPVDIEILDCKLPLVRSGARQVCDLVQAVTPDSVKSIQPQNWFLRGLRRWNCEALNLRDADLALGAESDGGSQRFCIKLMAPKGSQNRTKGEKQFQ